MVHGQPAMGPEVSFAVFATDVVALVATMGGTAKDAIHPQSHANDVARPVAGTQPATLPAKGRDKPAPLAALTVAVTQFLKDISPAPPVGRIFHVAR